MAQKKGYSRYFIILQEDEKGYSLSNDKLPSGYVKLELRNEKCKISYYVQNLKKGNSPYYMVLICNKKDVKKIIKIGEMNIDEHGRTDISFEYPLESVAETSISVDKISGAAIVKLLDDNIISVMSGFSTTEIPEWKAYDIEGSVHKEIIREEEVERSIFDDYEEKIEVTESTEEKIEVTESTEEKDDILSSFARGFDRFENISEDIKRCIWYKVPMEEFDESSEIYYPIMNLYPYVKKKDHFLLGGKYGIDGQLKYLIYGISGKRERVDQPFNGESGFVTWVSNKGEDDGYWLMFYDYKTSTIVVPTK